ncbi:MAG: diadenylate cyclase [Deltaproteobacteria bacterium]|nr:diadenylate cyclase [Deltaproteobacteria bacterium]
MLGVFILSKKLGMVTFQWIVGNFLGYLIIILVVIFQAEIRRGLAKVGQARIFGRSPAAPTPGVLEELSGSAIRLSASRTGAILLVEREMKLGEYVEHGRKIDALFSYELLVSLLATSSPLHDGAVVIRGDRIAAAGVILPFAVEPAAARLMGTRHRAALSTAVETDAVAVVVSEETGKVTVFHDRTAEEVADEAELLRVLIPLFGQRREERDAGK